MPLTWKTLAGILTQSIGIATCVQVTKFIQDCLLLTTNAVFPKLNLL